MPQIERSNLLLEAEEITQKIIKRQFGEIAKQSVLMEKRITEILEEVKADYNKFEKIHSFINFKSINKKFFKRLTVVASKLKFYEKMEITDYLLLYEYDQKMNELLAVRKEIMNDIILNAIETDSLDEELNVKDVFKEKEVIKNDQ